MFIEFSEINLKILLFIIYPICRRIQSFINDFYIENKEDDRILFKIFRYYLCFSISIIFLLIFKYKTNWAPKVKNQETDLISNEGENEEKEDEKSSNLDQTEITQRILDKKRKIKNILYLFLLCLIGFLSFYCRYLFPILFNEEFVYSSHSIRTFFEITNYSILSYILINQNLYIHHFISFGFISIILIIIFFYTIDYFMEKIYYHFLFHFAAESLYASYDILIKRYMNRYFQNPYYIMFYIGLVNTILLLIYDLFAYFLFPDYSGIILGFQYNVNSIKNFALFFVDLIFEYGWNLGIWLIIFYYSPCHFFIVEYISEFIYLISGIIEKKDFYEDNWFIILICYIFIFFFCLIFNEVIILNFCGLDYNTRKRISEREKKEYKSIHNNDIIIRDSVLTESEEES